MFPTKGMSRPTFSTRSWVQYVRPQGRHTMHYKSRMVGGDSFGAAYSVHLSGPSANLRRLWIIHDRSARFVINLCDHCSTHLNSTISPCSLECVHLAQKKRSLKTNLFQGQRTPCSLGDWSKKTFFFVEKHIFLRGVHIGQKKPFILVKKNIFGGP